MKLKSLILFVVTVNVYCQNSASSQSAEMLASVLREATYPLATAAGDLHDAGGKVMPDAITIYLDPQ
jgi:hypothetical protein